MNAVRELNTRVSRLQTCWPQCDRPASASKPDAVARTRC